MGVKGSWYYARNAREASELIGLISTRKFVREKVQKGIKSNCFISLMMLK